MNRNSPRKPGVILRRARPVAQYAAVLLISLNLWRLPGTVVSWPGFQAPRALLMLWTAWLLFLAWRNDTKARRKQEMDREAKDRRETRLLTYLAWSVPGLFLVDAAAIAHLYDCWFRSGAAEAGSPPWLFTAVMAAGCILWIYGRQVRNLPYRSIWGLRTAETLSGPDAWKRVHDRLMLPLLLTGAVCLLIGTMGTAFTVPH